MKAAAKKTGRVISMALTWDGARWPSRSLPPKARAFLSGQGPISRQVAKLATDNQVQEIRICWVPKLKGGESVLSDPFTTATGKRRAFRMVRSQSFGDVLGVIYQRPGKR
jgi:hypothetical protein